MIEKAELLSTLSTILELEEEGIKHIEDEIIKEIPGAGLSDSELCWFLKEFLEVINEDTVGHAEMLRDMIEKVKGDPRDAF